MLATIYIFIPVSGCVGRVPVHCFAWGLYSTVKTVLHTFDVDEVLFE